jgi:hypothetical protein
VPDSEPRGWQSCRVRLWKGYVKKQFYAETASGEWVGKSPYFRLEQGEEIEDSHNAAAAFDALVERLLEDGWEITGRPVEGSFDLSLKRRTDAAERTPGQSVT